MSKRHHITSEHHDHTIPADLPFRNDLIFYAPLTEQCCCDYVSNTIPEVDADHASCNWDTIENAWKLYVEGTWSVVEFYAALNYYNLNFFSGEGTDSIHSRGITLFMQRKNVSENCSNGFLWWMETDNGHVGYVPEAATGSSAAANLIKSDSIALNIRASSVGGFNIGAWHKFAVTQDSTGYVRWYRDGQQTGSANWSGNMRGEPHSIAIQQKREQCSNATAYAKDCRVYNRALTAQEIAQL